MRTIFVIQLLFTTTLLMVSNASARLRLPRLATTSCIDVVCDKLGAFGCNEQAKIDEVARLCSDGVEGSCVQAMCAKLGPLDCDDISEIEPVAQLCADHVHGSCVDLVCSKLGPFACDDLTKLAQVAQDCRGQ